ncbi:hypothetical protein AMELA_G00246970 [Ameiurus melas]|uniref:Uncharacterized protein n=1 Tax=Ameiurus melas TaxID=219545 RepID=A0A7J5ZVH3_AMEME|nr:hypothetical protein AMELA_G00246970 [Ameiurus melas]
MMDLFQPRNNSEGHICSTVHGEECCSPCIGDVGNFAMQTSKGDLHLRKPVNERQKSSFRTGSRKRQFKSPREGDNDDDNHETLPMIRRQLYGPGGPYEHKVQVRSSCEGDNGSNNYETLVMTDDRPPIPGGPDENLIVNQTDSEPECSNHDDEEGAGASQQPAKKAKRKCKSPRKVDNDEDNHESLAIIRQQLHGPGGPDGNMRVNQTESESRCSKTSLGNLKRCRDDHEDEDQTAFSQQPAKKARIGSSEIFDLEISGPYVDEVGQGDAFGKHPAKKTWLGSSEIFDLRISPSFSDMANLQRLNRQSMPSSVSGKHKVQVKSSCDGDNGSNDYETFVMTYNRPPIPGCPDENPIVNQTDSESECSNHDDEEEVGASQQPAQKAKRKCKSPHEGDNDEDNHESLAMIRQQLHGPAGPDGNMRVNQTESESHCSKSLLGNLMKRCWDDHEDEEQTAFSQQPAKKARIGSSEIFDLRISPGFSDMANLQRLNRQSMPSSVSGKHKVQVKSSCDGDNGSNDYETFVMTYNRPPIPGGPDENPIVNQTDSESECSNHDDEEEAGTSQQPAQKVWFASSESRLIAMLFHLTDIPNLKPVSEQQNPIVNQTDSEPECSNHEDEEEAGASQQPEK